MKKLIPLAGILFGGVAQADPIEGCYLTSDRIASFISQNSETKSTYIEVSRIADDFFVEGAIWGANFHVCHIGSPVEGAGGPLEMTYVDDKLIYSEDDPKYGISCNLEISFSGKMLTISDSNGHCARYIFYCGVRVGLDGVTLPKTDRGCSADDT